MQTAEMSGATISYEKGKCYHCLKEILIKEQNGFWRVDLCPYCHRLIRPWLAFSVFNESKVEIN